MAYLTFPRLQTFPVLDSTSSLVQREFLHLHVMARRDNQYCKQRTVAETALDLKFRNLPKPYFEMNTPFLELNKLL